MISPALRGALTDQSELLPLRELPVEAARLLDVLHAPPRLAAHLRLVHDVAAALTVALERRYPDLAFDRVAVLFGAATHDITSQPATPCCSPTTYPTDSPASLAPTAPGRPRTGPSTTCS